MDKQDLIFEEMYAATIELLENGWWGDVVAFAVAAMTFQCGGYLMFQLVYLSGLP